MHSCCGYLTFLSGCADAPAKAVQGSGVRVGPAKSTRWTPDSPIQAAGVPSKPQGVPESPNVRGPAEEVAPVAANMALANSALAPAGSRAGQVVGSQGSMLPSQSRKLAHLALQVKEPSPEARRLSTHTSASRHVQQMCLLASVLTLKTTYCSGQNLVRPPEAFIDQQVISFEASPVPPNGIM